ncbi:T-cell surface protein tactile isoform X2 [Gadus morhua]|uniref:T-cell surface protein tactile isoform X2 n=1 Tax=Gadus morhua TaxID=8049 RepID=UPI0011B6C3F8|nr:T-cell surface protein tactile-like isoform X2 [Gadus morhua]
MMCFENLPEDMSRAIFSLLLFGTALQGLEALKVIHFEKEEVAVGQNISLPCIFNDTFDVKISQIEWRKKPSLKLVVHHVKVGPHYFRNDVWLQTEVGDNDTLQGSYLQLFNTQVNDSGTYVCELITYPYGSMSRETQLEVKDAEVTCDKDSTLEVHVGDNVTVQCEVRLYPTALYKWFKNETVVSENCSLEVVLMDESQAGVYTLTVSTGHKTLQRSFNVTVLTPTESPSTELTTILSQNTNHSSTGVVYVPTTGPVEASSTLETRQNVSSSVPTTQATTENTYTTAESRNESFTVRPISSSSATTLGLETHRGSTERAGNVTEERVPGDVDHQHTATSTTVEIETDIPDGLTRKTANLSSSRLTTEETVVVVKTSGTAKGSTSRYGLLAIVLCLVLFVVFTVLYRRHIVQKRLDRPPPFKPPPPPLKYTSLKPQQIPMNSSCTWQGELGGQ